MGRTNPTDTPWQTYTGPTPQTSGLYVDLDYSLAGFKEIPIIIPALIGEANNWVMQVTVAEQTPSIARIYIRSALDGYTPTSDEANTRMWSVNFAMYSTDGGGPCYTLTWTIATNPCDGWV